MKNNYKLEILVELVQLINRKATGTPRSLAAKLGISERTVYRMLEHLKACGALIQYCYIQKTYLCENEIVAKFIFEISKQEE